eukprot:1546176-Pleurochrysis_carterae.AAC.3
MPSTANRDAKREILVQMKAFASQLLGKMSQDQRCDFAKRRKSVTPTRFCTQIQSLQNKIVGLCFTARAAFLTEWLTDWRLRERVDARAGADVRACVRARQAKKLERWEVDTSVDGVASNRPTSGSLTRSRPQESWPRVLDVNITWCRNALRNRMSKPFSKLLQSQHGKKRLSEVAEALKMSNCTLGVKMTIRATRRLLAG